MLFHPSQSWARQLLVAAVLLHTCVARGATYYIDYSGGSNANPGTKAAPWKTHPYMQAASACTGSGNAPSYSHAAGDTFIFKMGERWPNPCFELSVGAGGAPGLPDRYTFDASWGTPPGRVQNGATIGAYTFDAQGTEITAGLNRFIYDDGIDNIVFDGMELTGLKWTGSPSYGNAQLITLYTSQNVTVSNCYAHGWTHPGATSDVMIAVDGYAGPPFNAGSRVTNCLFDGVGASDSGEAVSKIPLLDHNVVRNMSNGLLPNANAVVHDNLIGPINRSFDSTDHENCIEPIVMGNGVTSTNYFYNNVWHDCTAVGILTQGAAPSTGVEIDYLWNNIAFVGSAASPPIPFQFDSVSTRLGSCEVHAWNNTIVGGNGACLRTVGRGNGNFGVLDLQNNACISGGSLIQLDVSAANFTNTANLLSASATGFNGPSDGAPFSYSPASAASPTVGQGVNLSSLAIGAMASLANDATYGGFRGALARPVTGAWDIGAYQWTGQPVLDAGSPAADAGGVTRAPDSGLGEGASADAGPEPGNADAGSSAPVVRGGEWVGGCASTPTPEALAALGLLAAAAGAGARRRRPW